MPHSARMRPITEQDGTKQPVGYWSKTVAKPRIKLAVTHKECLAVVCAFLILRTRLPLSRVTVRTDHEQVKCLLTLVEATCKPAC